MKRVERSAQERVARNESLYRDANEGIEKGIWPDERDVRVPFRCECPRVDCNQTVELTAEEYEHVRADPRRFAVVDGHEVAEAEVVVERHPGYVVVEKQGPVAAVAEQLDPRG